MAIVTYGEARLYPSPLYSLSSTINKTDDGTPISVNYDITLTGTLLPSKGNPSSSGEFPDLSSNAGIANDTSEGSSDLRFKALLTKQQALTQLFQQDGLKLEIYNDSSLASTVKYTGYPEVVNISFSQGVTVDRTDYTINLRGIELVGNDLDYPASIASAIKANLQSLSESFSVNEELDIDDDGNDIKVYSVTHTASATARQSYNRSDAELPGPNGSGESDPDLRAYENARAVLKGLVTVSDNDLSDSGHLSSFLLGTGENINVAEYAATDDFTSESGDYFGGTYTISRTIRLRPKNENYLAIHEYNVDSQFNSPNLTSIKSKGRLGYSNTFSISGSIRGIRGTVGNEIQTAYESAEAAYNELIVNKDYSKVIALINGLVNNETNLVAGKSVPSSASVSRSKRKGEIAYSFSFIDKPSSVNIQNDDYFIDFDINVNETHDDNSIAVIPILGRAHGPIIQKLNTTGTYTRNITGTFVLRNKGTEINNGQPYQWDDIDTIRKKALAVIKAQPAELLSGTQGTDWHVTNWNDGMDIFNGVFNINITLAVVRDKNIVDVNNASGGWMEF